MIIPSRLQKLPDDSVLDLEISVHKQDFSSLLGERNRKGSSGSSSTNDYDVISIFNREMLLQC